MQVLTVSGVPNSQGSSQSRGHFCVHRCTRSMSLQDRAVAHPHKPHRLTGCAPGGTFPLKMTAGDEKGMRTWPGHWRAKAYHEHHRHRGVTTTETHISVPRVVLLIRFANPENGREVAYWDCAAGLGLTHVLVIIHVHGKTL